MHDDLKEHASALDSLGHLMGILIKAVCNSEKRLVAAL